MARDTFILFSDYDWPNGRPSNSIIEGDITLYTMGIGNVEWNGDRWFITLPDVKGVTDGTLRGEGFGSRPRWIEVVPHSNCVDVLTRLQDGITNAIADGLARFIASRNKGLVTDD